MKNPWETLGVDKDASEEEIRKAFRRKAMYLHPDKGGSASEFRELYDAYNILRNPAKKDDDSEWMSWLSRWASRFLGDDNKILKVKIPLQILKDRGQTITIEYDGIPVNVELLHTEKTVFGGLRIRIIPHALIMRTGMTEEEPIADDPWRTDTQWLFSVPKDTAKFKIKGGEWSEIEGDYGNDVFWKKDF